MTETPEEPRPIEITDEMRAAVLAEMCAAQGHVYSLTSAVDVGPSGSTIKAKDDRLPHISCARCGRVWLVQEESFASYDEAEQQMYDKLKDPAPIEELREKRKKPKK
jgi:hypothetical protein